LRPRPVAKLTRDLIALRERYAERLLDPKLHPADARAVLTLAGAFPLPQEPS